MWTWGRGEGGMNWEIRTQMGVMRVWNGDPGGRVCMYTYSWFISLYRNLHNIIIRQLYPNKKYLSQWTCRGVWKWGRGSLWEPLSACFLLHQWPTKQVLRQARETEGPGRVTGLATCGGIEQPQGPTWGPSLLQRLWDVPLKSWAAACLKHGGHHSAVREN